MSKKQRTLARQTSSKGGNAVKEFASNVAQVAQSRQAVFGFFWGLAHFIDEFRQPSYIVTDGIQGLMHAIVFVLAVALMYKPSSTIRIFMLSATSLTVGFMQMPITPNHNMIYFMVDTAIVVSIFVFVWFTKKPVDSWFTRSEPFFRLGLLITYGSATLAKLNTSWSDLQVSCATTMPAKEFAWLPDFTKSVFGTPLVIDWTSIWILPIAIAGAEFMIFLLPLFKKTRPYAIPLAVVFHISLSLTPVSNGLGFSFLLYSLLALYLPDDAMVRIHTEGKRFMAKAKERGLLPVVAYGFFAFSVYIGFQAFLNPQGNEQDFWRYLPSLFALAVFGGILAVSSIYYRNSVQTSPAVAVRHWAHGILLAVIVLNSMGPYLGIKTYATMTMFSNLQVENGQTNHLIFPRVPWETMVDDTVEILDTNNKRLSDRFVGTGYLITYHELRRELAQSPGASITYVRDGETFSYAQALENPELVTIDPLLHQLIGFRPIAPTAECLW